MEINEWHLVNEININGIIFWIIELNYLKKLQKWLRYCTSKYKSI